MRTTGLVNKRGREVTWRSKHEEILRDSLWGNADLYKMRGGKDSRTS
jgi:hypothetical protein